MTEQGSHCLECGPDVRVDGEGCCAGCGRWAMWYDGGECMCADAEDGPCPQCLHKIAAIEAENERLRAERDTWKTQAGSIELIVAKELRAERDAALAKVARLREGLRDIESNWDHEDRSGHCCGPDHDHPEMCRCCIAGAALKETEADR